ncbi:Hybrid signal transduction histidine kinase K [Seminavis robusta]|uniref:histidine kinase n=1 Tax=Seminavis robusta TaxID=568900 RepID=A0A9N8E3H1_9STRA|nr:Hybrid signal transduction histidine kinase K [Seminavis robusta]|eukprot:Sro507_g156480.1 Hybrid signal transduction histidine kinase K (899) ;mRNA; r:18867-21739
MPNIYKAGDFVAAATFTTLCFALVIPECDDRPSYFVAAVHLVAGAVGFCSCFSDSMIMTIATTICNAATICSMNVLNVPRYDDSPLIPMMIWLYVMLNANLGLPFRVTAGLSIFLFLTGVFAACMKPEEVNLDKPLAFRTIGAATFLHILVHWLVLSSSSCGEGKSSILVNMCPKLNPELLTMHGARLVLGGVFVHNLLADVATIEAEALLLGDSAVGMNIAFLAVKAGFVFAVGLAAIGAFRKNIDMNEKLETLVQQRTSQLQQQDRSLNMFGRALQASETAIAITDSTQNIIWLNPALVKLSGMKEKDLEHRSILDVLSLSLDDRQKLSGAFRTNSRDPIMLKVGLHTVVTAELTSLSADQQQSTPDHFVVALKDITEAQALERAQVAAEKDALMAKVMKESMETLTHELRTPLQGIMGVCSMLRCDASFQLPDQAMDSLDLIMASSSLLLVLINNLLDIRKIDSHMMDKFQLSPTSSKSPLQDSADFCRPLAKISGVEIDIQHKGTEHAVVMANDLRLQQVLINLISNGIKYTPSGSTIRIESRTSTLGETRALAKAALACGRDQSNEFFCSESNSRNDDVRVLVVSVVDAGLGIAPGQEKRMFRKFAQLDSKQQNVLAETGQPGGTGLGLNLCQKFVHLMKGDIWVDNNTDGPGSAFSFYLPLVSNEDPAANRNGTKAVPHQQRPRECSDRKESQVSTSLTAKTTQAPKATPIVHNLTSGLRILVVDDILINRKVLSRMFRQIGVKSVETAESGEEALKRFEDQEVFDIVISDLQMPPGMSGLEFSVALHKMDHLRRHPVVIGLTADTSPDLHERCIASGMVDVIHKPVTVGDLTEYFGRLLQPPKSTNTAAPLPLPTRAPLEQIRSGVWARNGVGSETGSPRQLPQCRACGAA